MNTYYDKEGKIIEHECIIEGDNTYLSIAAASILAKTHHDEHIAKIIEENPDYKKYDIHNNIWNLESELKSGKKRNP